MKNRSDKLLRKILCSGLAMTLVLSSAAIVYAAEESPVEQTPEVSQTTQTNIQESPQEPASAPAESTGSAVQEPAAAESPSPAPVQEVDTAAEPVAAGSQEDPGESVSAEQPSDDVAVTEEAVDAEGSPAPSAPAARSTPAANSGTRSASNSSAVNSITIGDTSFSSSDDESSHWSDTGKGWKNVAGQYVAMVDYDGSAAEISADGGTITLAVAGVNRIGTLKGDCSFQIAGTGIVLIDSIDIADGNSITLHPNTSIYDEGSAAVFLKQEDGDSYVLINGGITGILDEVYSLDDVKLVLPEGSSLMLGVTYIRKETWDPYDGDGPVEDITLYTTDPPYDVDMPVHDNGYVDKEKIVGSVVLGKNSALTVESGAAVKLNKMNVGLSTIEAELIVQGILDIKGVLEGGYVGINDGGSLTGDGTVRSAQIDLRPEGILSEEVLLENSGLTIYGDNRSVTPPQIKDSTIYLKGSGITIPELKVSGTTSWIGVETYDNLPVAYKSCRIGNITLSSGSSLEIVCNEHNYASFSGERPRYVEDSHLTITGMITGGAVYVLGGIVEYIGTQTDVLPVVPNGYASRVYVTELDMDSTDFPLNITDEQAYAMARSSQIPVMRLYVEDTLISEDVLARKWAATQLLSNLAPLVRNSDRYFTCESFLNAYRLDYENNEHTTVTAVEVIKSDLSRQRFFVGDDILFNTDDVIMIRVLTILGKGGQGGSSNTHTNTSFTGNGVIGGPGSGSLKSGAGTIVYVVGKPAQPDPKPDDNGDNNNNSSNNNSSNNNNNNHNGSSNNSNNTYNGNNSNNNRNSNTGRKTSGRAAAAAVNTGSRYVVTIELREPKTSDPAKTNAEMPQIWQLTVTNAGAPVTDLTGNPIRALFPFTVPESWGDPAEIPENSLYAVFADENGELTAYAAQYDPQTGEVWFDAEQTGDFVIVQFAYEGELFTEDFYSALADLEDVKVLLEALKDGSL